MTPSRQSQGEGTYFGGVARERERNNRVQGNSLAAASCGWWSWTWTWLRQPTQFLIYLESDLAYIIIIVIVIINAK